MVEHAYILILKITSGLGLLPHIGGTKNSGLPDQDHGAMGECCV